MRVDTAQIFHAAILDTLMRRLVVQHVMNHRFQEAHAVRMRRDLRHFALGK